MVAMFLASSGLTPHAEAQWKLAERSQLRVASTTDDSPELSLYDALLQVAVDYQGDGDLSLHALGRGRLETELEPTRYAQLGLRELTLLDEGESYSVSLGRQQVVWGKVDGFLLLDLVNPFNQREFLLDDYVDTRIPTWMINAQWFGEDDDTLQLLVIPDVRFNRLPRPGGRFFPAALPLAADYVALERRWATPDDWEYGMKWSSMLGELNFALHGFWGWVNTPALDATLASPTRLGIRERAVREGVTGLTADYPVGPIVLRAEGLLSSAELVRLLPSPTAPLSFEAKPGTRLALGVDWFPSGWLVSGQLFHRALLELPTRADDEVSTLFASALLRKRLLYDTAQIELFGAYGVSEADYWLSATASYELFGHLALRGGVDVFGGGSQGLLGRYDAQDRLRLELDYRIETQ